ncbi:MAG TPA: TIGR03960 family B12-binding radical SAM protein [Candidatus Obscuribacterales bacterium]
MLTEQLLYQVNKPGQYLGNEWGAALRDFDSAEVRLCLAFPDIYELGMSNFGQRILYQIVNARAEFMADRTYAPASDLEPLLRERGLPVWGFESRRAVNDFELIGFSLQYELTYTNVLNMLDLSAIPIAASDRESIFPLVFGGGPSCVNPEPMSKFLDFFIIGDGEQAVPQVMEVVRDFKQKISATPAESNGKSTRELRKQLLQELATRVSGVYVPSLYAVIDGQQPAMPQVPGIPERVPRQVMPLNADNQPAGGLVPYLALVHDRQVLEVRRGCDRGCRFCQPGYTFLPVRERTTDELVAFSKEALDKSGYQEYSLLSLCVSDYTSLHETVRALNREHASRRASMSFPSQRADRMNFDIAEELKSVRKSGITLAPEAGTERLRAVINKGLNHEQIINAITTAYKSGWSSVKLYYMIGLPTERDEDLQGIVDTLKEATDKCYEIRRADKENHKAVVEFTCTMSNTVPKPFTPFQWYGQPTCEEFARKQTVMRAMLRASGLRNVKLNFTPTGTSMLEAVISRGDRQVAELIEQAWRNGCTFDAWEDRLQLKKWQEAAEKLGVSLQNLAGDDREVGSPQPWDVVNVGLANWWLVNEWKKAMAVKETAPCSENTCHACGVCTDLKTTHVLADPSEVVLGKNPFVKKAEEPQAGSLRSSVAATPCVAQDANAAQNETHPSLFVQEPPAPPPNKTVTQLVFEFSKTGEMKFIGHLDLQHLLIRAARRANIFVAYTEGFNPGPKLSLALSLALYNEGLAEMAEIELSEEISAEDFVRRMNAQLPPEVQLARALVVQKSNVALAQYVGRATYRALLAQDCPEAGRVKEIVSQLLAQPTLEVPVTPSAKSLRKQQTRSRSNRHRGEAAPQAEAAKPQQATRDIKTGIYSMKVVENSESSGSPIIEMELAHGSRLHIKPSEVLKLVADDAPWRLIRVGLATDDGTPLFDYCCRP